MHLKAFVESKHGRAFKQSEWARKLNVSRGYFNQLVHGTKSPSLELALLIDTITGSMVSPYDWPRAQPSEDSTDGGNSD